MKKKLLCLALASAMALSLAACGQAAPAASSAASASGSSAASGSASGKTYNVGIIQLVQHPALDAATKGFQNALTDALGDAVHFDLQNAAGDSATCSTMATQMVSSGVDLILANATSALQAAAAATSDIPILGTSVTEYGVALSIDGFKAPWVETSPAPPTWRLWTNRPRCSPSCCPTPRRLAFCTAPARPTPSIKQTR